MPGVFGPKINHAAVWSDSIRGHGTVEALGDDGWLRLRSPVQHCYPVQTVTLGGCLVIGAVQRLSIRPEYGSSITISTRSKPLRLTPFRRRLKQIRIGVGIGRPVPIGRCGEHDRVSVGRPGGAQLFGAIGLSPGETASRHELRASEQISWPRAGFEDLNEEMDLPVIEPTIPISNGESVIDSGVVLAGLAFGGNPLARFVIG